MHKLTQSKTLLIRRRDISSGIDAYKKNKGRSIFSVTQLYMLSHITWPRVVNKINQELAKLTKKMDRVILFVEAVGCNCSFYKLVLIE
ncbi:hypothetical protein [Wolbachia endosymbiont of Litomosoides sigmodontis]|uniref:hypothetical protein n=1 Tax=Wolbachia endosymbiont of Litomosoides sigmodontis TaxID=80850 RepID=UPI001C553856|nr:hypothetical protein [Wolbachia endosymbiont of Litomosoides sigmodontis]